MPFGEASCYWYHVTRGVGLPEESGRVFKEAIIVGTIVETLARFLKYLIPSVSAKIIASVILLLAAGILRKLGVWRKIRALLIRLRIVNKLDEIHKAHYEQEHWYLVRFQEIVERNRWDPNKYIRPDLKVKPSRHTRISPRLVLLDGRDIQSDSPIAPQDLKISTRKTASLLTIVQDLKMVVLLGDPGSGKTVCLLQAGTDMATRGMLSSSVSPKLPVYIPLSEYTAQQDDGSPEDVGNFIVMQLRSQLSGSMSDEFISRFDVLKRDGRFLFIFDAMDEMPRSDYYPRFYRLCEFAQRNSNNLFLFSCRFLDYIDDPAFAFSQAILSPFSETQIAEMLRRYLGKEFRHFKTAEFLSDRGIGLKSRSPFFVSLVAACKRAGVEPGSTWDALIENYVDVALDECRDYLNLSASESEWRILRRDTLKWLSELAFELAEQRATGTKADGSLVERTLASYDNRAKLMDVAQRAGIIKSLSDPGSVKFYHHKLQEFFAAKRLVTLYEESKIDLGELTDDIWWQEVLIMSAGLVPDPDGLILGLLPHLDSSERFAYSDIGKDFNRVILVIGCYFAARKRVHLETARLLKGYMQRYLSRGNILQKVRMLRLVSLFGDRELLEDARRCLKHSSSWVRETALLAIAESITYIPASARSMWREILKPSFAGVAFRMKLRDIPILWRNPSIRRFIPLLVLLITYRSIVSGGVYLCGLCAFIFLWYIGLWGAPFFAILFAVLAPVWYCFFLKRWALPISRGVVQKLAPGREPYHSFNATCVNTLIVAVLPLWILSLGIHYLAEYLGGILLVLASLGLFLLEVVMLAMLIPLLYKWWSHVLEKKGVESIPPKEWAELFGKAGVEFKRYRAITFVDPSGMSMQEREQTALSILDEIERCPFPDLRADGIEALLGFLPLGESVLSRLAKLNEKEPSVDVRTKGWQVYEQIDLSLRRAGKEE